jgi:hypothetical protein
MKSVMSETSVGVYRLVMECVFMGTLARCVFRWVVTTISSQKPNSLSQTFPIGDRPRGRLYVFSTTTTVDILSGHVLR